MIEENNGKGLLAQIRNTTTYNPSSLTYQDFERICQDMVENSKKVRFRYPGLLLVNCSDEDFKVFYKRKDIEWGPVGSKHYKIIQDRIKKLIDGGE